MNWKLTLSYDGNPYNGWQIQPTLPTVQGTLAATILSVTGESVLPQGSGRTDAGVHALAQVTSFRLEANIPPANLQRALNHALPPSIRILSAEHAPEDFHARYSALGKTYEYRIFPRRQAAEAAANICPPFLAPYIWDCPWPLDLDRMQTAAADILGTHDFTSFAAVDPDSTERHRSLHNAPAVPPQKTVTESMFSPQNDHIIYRITGSGFLHHMVRNLVGTLVEIGREALPANAIPQILAARSRSAAGPTAPPNGLFLHTVHYQ
jgi:tRNA pseudouridine38-40 synthase